MSNQQNSEVFVIDCPTDTVVFMTMLERHLYVLAGMYPDIYNTFPGIGIYAGGSMAMVRRGLMHSVNGVDIAFRNRDLANALLNAHGKDYFKDYKFAGVDIDFGPDGAALEGSDAVSIVAASGYFYNLSELHSQYTELLRWAKEKQDKVLEDKFNGRLALLRTI